MHLSCPLMNKNIYFLSGLPRTGTTLLSCILNQNSNVHVSSTSGLLDFLAGVNFIHCEVSKRYSFTNQKQIKNIYRSIFHAWYEHIDSPVIIDKWRGWIDNVNQLKEVTGSSPKIIYLYRPIEEIITSFLYLLDKDSNNFVDKELVKIGKKVNNKNRSNYLWEHGVVGESYKMLERYLYLNNSEDVLFLKYSDLVHFPNKSLKEIYQFLNIDYFEHNFEKINLKINDNDEYWNIKDLHKIRKKIQIEIKGPENYLSFEDIEFYKKKNSLFEQIS